MAVFTPSLQAVLTTGPLTYPPKPTTTSGLNSLIIFLTSLDELIIRKSVLIFLAIFLAENFLWKPVISMVLNAKPAAGTSFDSICSFVPIKSMSASGWRRLSSPADASAGFICPPVPPAANMTFICLLLILRLFIFLFANTLIPTALFPFQQAAS